MQLATLVGPASADRLVATFGREPSQVWLRRCAAHGECIDFHLDHCARTMQVPLNGDDEYEGGRLVFVAGGKMHAPPRPAGSFTIHDDAIAHGVSTLICGVRYSLFLRGSRDRYS